MLRSATWAVLRAHSVLMRWARSAARVRRRVGIMAPRGVVVAGVGGGVGMLGVGVVGGAGIVGGGGWVGGVGKSRWLPGWGVGVAGGGCAGDTTYWGAMYAE